MPKGEFFLEVRCEEIPARMLERGAEELGRRLFEELVGLDLTPREVQTGFTPRRLAVTVRGLPAAEADRSERVLGPPAEVAFDADGAPTPAARGFAKRCQVGVEALERVQTEKGEYVAAVSSTRGRPTAQVLAELAPRILAGLNWPKTMRWGVAEGPWVRPVHGVVAIFAGSVVEFELFGVRSGDTTVGHPLRSPRSFKVRGSAEYQRKLRARGVVVDFDARRATLAEGLEQAAEEAGGQCAEDPELLDKLAAICGIPGVVAGRFDERFLELPREVLVASLRDHQSAFTVEGDDGLLPVFLTLMDRQDDPEGRVRAGNEWVVAARLEDARFFFGEDRKAPLVERAAQLERLAFHERLGSYGDKAARLVELGELLCSELGWTDLAPEVKAATELLKVDLTTEMVREFTSLQGVMGGIYARLDGHPGPVWKAIYDQYLPASAEDPIPRGRAGQVVALADRVDTLIGILGLGLKPTGSKDPFGLRRAALGVVRIALEGELALDLDLVAAKAYQLYGDRLTVDGQEVLAQWRPFLHDRVRYVLGRAGYAYDEIEAALVVGGAHLPDLQARVAALHEVRDEAGFLDVVLAAKRIANILKEKPEGTLDTELFAEPAEKDLYEALEQLRGQVDEAEQAGDYATCLRRITGFAEVLDRFFVEVLVMDENLELRNNRLGLLQSIQRVLSRTAGLTEMVVDRSRHRERGER